MVLITVKLPSLWLCKDSILYFRYLCTHFKACNKSNFKKVLKSYYPYEVCYWGGVSFDLLKMISIIHLYVIFNISKFEL